MRIQSKKKKGKEGVRIRQKRMKTNIFPLSTDEGVSNRALDGKSKVAKKRKEALVKRVDKLAPRQPRKKKPTVWGSNTFLNKEGG